MITVDPDTQTPPYEQIRAQVVAHVDSGELQPGDRLPTVRRLAEDLGVAANTVARAYRELEQSGVIETRGRAGSFVTGDQVERKAKEAAATYLAQVTALGLTPADAVALVRHLEQHPVRSS
ncbi:GntR family transcriptional regulator [Marmoricola sp. RAF53]|uniref:GntR family transcriptional regulator n=1 Tax=Marmoricola sp. RAF53 TaxID=3233059 RepID=UPI003F9BEECD